MLGSLAAMLMLAPRVVFRDGPTTACSPLRAAAVHPRFGTPARAIATQALLASVLVALGTFDTIVAYFVFITVVFIAVTVGAVFVLRRRDPAFQVPGYPWTADGVSRDGRGAAGAARDQQSAAGTARPRPGRGSRLPVYRLIRRARPPVAQEILP